MSEFKPGDKVRRIKDDHRGVKKGGIYTVRDIRSDEYSTIGVRLEGFDGTWSNDRFELIPPRTKTVQVVVRKITDFQTGDKIVKPDSRDSFPVVEREVPIEPSGEFVVPEGWRTEQHGVAPTVPDDREVIGFKPRGSSVYSYYVRKDEDD